MDSTGGGAVAVRMAPSHEPDVERFRAVVAVRLGLQFDDSKLPLLADVLRRRLEASGVESETYLLRLEAGRAPGEVAALAQELTVGETYFFRHREQYRAFVDVALAERLRARSRTTENGALRILSAGCASGEEPYSLAILVRESLAEGSSEVSVRAVDINPVALRKAQAGRFSTWALRETPLDIQQRWFRPEGREAVLNDEAKARVTFEERNLIHDDAELWSPQNYDIVFCRNVIMYLTPESARALVARIANALVPGGYLFLGHAETLRGLSQDFHLLHTHEAFYYRCKDPFARSPVGSETPIPLRVAPAPDLTAVLANDTTWVQAIRSATHRIRALAEATPASAPSSPPLQSDVQQALDLLRRERFTDALGVIQALPLELAGDPDVLLLNAVLLTHGGRLKEAEEVCQRLLRADELNAGAHYVLALCREGAEDRQRAAEHDQVAVYLDPAFAMPHLHLGLLARRTDDYATARRELRGALDLLQREDASRLLLFGGGFNRETLIALCRAELQACGGQP